MNNKIKEIIERLDWSINEYEDCYELGNYSPAGEDLIITLNKNEDIVEQLKHEWTSFDPEEHAEMWFGANRGEPSSLRELLDDADEIEIMLENLHAEVSSYVRINGI